MSHWGAKPKNFDVQFRDKVKPSAPCNFGKKQKMETPSVIEQDYTKLMCPPYKPYFGGPKPTYFQKTKVELEDDVIPEKYPSFERADLKPCPARYFPPCEEIVRERQITRAGGQIKKKKVCVYSLQMPYSQYHEG